jgi:hypothetical protein
MHPRTRQTEIAREARRRAVAAALLAGHTNLRAIAAELKVDHTTVGRDVRVIEARWRDENSRVIGIEKAKDLDRLDRLLAAFWPLALSGDLRAGDRVLAIIARRAATLGYDAPRQSEERITLDLKAIAEEVAAEMELDPIAVLAETRHLMIGGG